MKRKITLFIAFSFASFGLFAQTQLMNGGFESWTSTSPSYPTDWGTYDALFATYGGISADSLDLCTQDTASANVFAGSSSCKLKTDSVPGFGINSGVVSTNTLGFTGTQPIFNGWAFTERPFTFNGAVKYLSPGNDTAYFQLLLTKWDATGDSEIIIGYTGYQGYVGEYLLGTGGGYATITDTIIYTVSGINPDTLSIYFASTQNPYGSTGHVGTTLWVDDLSFTYSAAGIVHFDMDDAIKVFPNPASNSLNVSIDNYMTGDKFAVYDISGRLVNSYILENSVYSIDLANYANGTYFYRVSDTNNKQVYQNKFIVTK